MIGWGVTAPHKGEIIYKSTTLSLSSKLENQTRKQHLMLTLPSRVGAVALYTVLWTVVAKYRKWPFSAPHRTKTP